MEAQGRNFLFCDCQFGLMGERTLVSAIYEWSRNEKVLDDFGQKVTNLLRKVDGRPRRVPYPSSPGRFNLNCLLISLPPVIICGNIRRPLVFLK